MDLLRQHLKSRAVPGPDGRKVAAIERQETAHVQALGERYNARIAEIQAEIGLLVKQGGSARQIGPLQRLQLPGRRHSPPTPRGSCLKLAAIAQVDSSHDMFVRPPPAIGHGYRLRAMLAHPAQEATSGRWSAPFSPMNKVIDRFGKAVGDAVVSSPRRARALLRWGFAAGWLQQELLPDRRLLPHQRVAAAMDTRAIRRPLDRPDRSAMVNLFFPCEILHAMEIAPQFTEGMACFLNGAGCEGAFIRYAEDAGVPPTLCSYHKILLGAALSDVLPPPRFVACTSLACDANLSTFRTIAGHYKVPHFAVDVPGACTGETIDYVASQLREVACGLEETMGKRLEEDRLRTVIRSANRSTKLLREHYHLLAGKHLPGDVTSEMNKIFPTHTLLGTPEAEEYFRLLLEDTHRAAPSRGEKRILWAHTIPYWQNAVRELFTSNGGCQLLACDLNVDSLEELDEARPYESMARRLLTNMLNGPAENRAARLTEMARALQADGVVYFCHWGCKQTLGAARLIQERLEREGFPVLVLDGDGCDRKNINEGQMRTRLQAFAEMLEPGR